MHRRNFIKGGIAGATAFISGAAAAHVGSTVQRSNKKRQGKHNFNLKYAPHFGMFKHHAGDDLLDQLQFMADTGFTALEDNRMKSRPVEMQEKIASKMTALGMEMGVFVAYADFNTVSFAGNDQQAREMVLKEVKASVDVAKRCNAKWVTVVPGAYDKKLAWEYQTANCIDLLKKCAEILEPHNLTMVLEPLNWHTNHPGVFLTEVPQGYMICQAVDSPSCKILDDLYHQQITEGNLIPNMDMAWDEIAYIQVGDNPGRKEPTTGEINYKNIFKHLHEKQYTGIVGMEHGNSMDGKAGEQAVIDAYIEVDSF